MMIERKFFNIRNITLVVIFIMLAWHFGTEENTIYDYVIYYTLLFFVIIKAFIQKKIPLCGIIQYDLIPGIFIIVWFYGVLIGVSYGNEWIGIIRNFAGMTLYSMYYVLLCLKIPKERILKIVFLAALFDILVAIGMSITNYRAMMLRPLIAEQSNLLRLYYSSSLDVIYVLIASLMTVLLVRKGRLDVFPITNSRAANFGLLLLGIFSIILSLSKGFLLGLIFILIVIPTVIFIREFSLSRFIVKIAVYLVPIFFVAGMLYNIGLGDLVENIFASDEISNASRYEQIEKLQSDYSYWGKGLGAKLESGFERDAMGYGFEVSFHNLIHKIGIFSIILFFLYFYTFYRAIVNLYRGTAMVYGAAAIGSMCFLFPSAGNPSLFSPTAVVLHSIALYWLRRESSISVKAHE